MAKASLKGKETRDELSTTCNPKVMSRCLSMPDATHIPTSLTPEPWLIFYYLKLKSGIGH